MMFNITIEILLRNQIVQRRARKYQKSIFCCRISYTFIPFKTIVGYLEAKSICNKADSHILLDFGIILF